MNGITSMQRSSTSYADYGKFASGKKVNRAADGAAELAIIQKQETQTRSYKVGENNIGAAKDMLNVADGAMSGITDYLQKIRELGVRASNTVTITDAERTSIQAQIEQYKQGISDIAKQTSFNTKPLLDGTSQKYNIMTDATGNGMKITTADATLQALGIADFDVTKDFDLTQVDDALARVSAGRSGMGAQSNALEYAYRYSTNTRLNVTAGKSRLEDLDYGQAEKEADPAAICIFYAEKTDGTENPRGGKFSCLISGGERRSEGFRAFLRRFLRTHGEEINILKNP